ASALKLFASRLPVSRICFLSPLFAFRISFTRIPHLLLTIALFDLPSYIQQYSYDINLTWLTV
ncbi:hypothetical protein, partial [Vibrio lentus]|uniref:hypothetical protein n=1 Tax=Vibrio lentus TaxID=136468 RepID=UPI00197F072F